ncbi:MAG: hypothetical protein MI741_16235, partial [Rhodospirillales bacterium]|nr:hypothetical protein [Rhodospirillales bacterium]
VVALAWKNTEVRGAAWIMIAGGRSVPLVCILLLFYWLPPMFSVDLPPLWCAVLAIGYVEACYLAVVLHSLWRVVEARHGEVAYVLGLPSRIWWTRVLLPQMSRFALPHFLNFLLYTLNSSALASFISVNDLTQTARIMATSTADPVAAYGVVYFAYLMLAAVLTFFGALFRSSLARNASFAVLDYRDA